MMREALRTTVLIGALVVVVSCSGDSTTGEPTSEIVIETVHARANEVNVLSALLDIRVLHADSVRVVISTGGSAIGSTPYFAVRDSAAVPVVGLRANTEYSFVLEAANGRETRKSSLVSFRTADLPTGLKEFRLVGTPRLPSGFVLSALAGTDGRGYVVAFDSTGAIAWYRTFPEFGYLPVGEVKQQANGQLTAFVGSTGGFDPTYGRYTEVDVAGLLVNSYAAVPPYYTDNHELLLTGEGDRTRAHMFGYDLRRTDLRPIGGAADVLLAGHQVLRQNAGGRAEFLWNAWDHVTIDEWIEEPAILKQQLLIDFDHPNSLAIDTGGHYIASFRGLGQIIRINANDGSIIWRLGGKRGDFRIEGDPLGLFSGQHSASMLANGNILMYDNGLRHSPRLSRAVEYRLDLANKVATMVWQYQHDPQVYTPFVGFTERLSNGSTFISWGGSGLMSEVTPTGSLVWEATMKRGTVNQSFYRARRIPSLYRYVKP